MKKLTKCLLVTITAASLSTMSLFDSFALNDLPTYNRVKTLNVGYDGKNFGSIHDKIDSALLDDERSSYTVPYDFKKSELNSDDLSPLIYLYQNLGKNVGIVYYEREESYGILMNGDKESLMETKRTHSEAKQMIKDIASKYSGATLDTARQIFIDLAKEYRYNFNECKAIQSGNVESGSVYSTLKNRAGVCWELSCIYAEILRQIGIDSYIVTALNREGYYKDESVANHQYNAMLIDGKIYTCDLSTAVCYMEVTGDPNLSMTFVEDPSFTLNHQFEFRRLY